VFNILTIHEFYQYLIDNKMYSKKDLSYMLYNMSTPDYLTCHILPPELKQKGRESLEKTIALLKANKFKVPQIQQIEDAIPWAMSQDTWDQHKRQFRSEVKRLDKIRGEDFSKTFPELADLLKPDRNKHFPI
jgi:hypothetical protein